jgi:hypothetical protein
MTIEAMKQEPVCDKDPRGCWSVRCQLGKVCKNTTPRQWQGLTDDELFAIWMKSPAETEDRFAFVKTVMERLKEKNHA